MEAYAVKRPDGSLIAESIASSAHDAMWFGRYRDADMRRAGSHGYSVVRLVDGEKGDPAIYLWCITRPDGTIINGKPWYPPSDVWFAWCDAVRIDPELHALNEEWRAEHDGKGQSRSTWWRRSD